MWDIKFIGRDVSCGACVHCLLCWMGVGGRVVVDLCHLEVLVV